MSGKTSTAPRLLLLPDFIEEGWPSMDLSAEMLASHLQRDLVPRLNVEVAQPKFHTRFGSRGRNADRLMNRFVDYPRLAGKHRDRFDLFHICDHSYSQLVHALPADRVGVYCHDLDTFTCLLEPARDPRPRWFRAMAGRILRGLKSAAVVFYSTNSVRAQIERFQLIESSRLVKAPLGVAGDFGAEDCGQDAAILSRISGANQEQFVLHVGSCIERKRIDVLLRAFAFMRQSRPELRLIQLGGEWSPTQRDLLNRLELQSFVVQLPKQRRTSLAALYRRASVVLITSDAEGFGLPVIEALACGTAVVASDIPPLHEAGGDAIEYAAVGDAESIARRAIDAIEQRDGSGRREARLRQASRFSWAEHARIIGETYLSRFSS